MADAGGAMATTAQTVYPVNAVTRYLRELLENNRHLADIWVEGEISNLSLPASGHIYFTLKDSNSAIRCAFFRNRIKGQRDRLEQGASVVIHGSMSVYEARGELSFIVDFVQPAGTGALQAERRIGVMEPPSPCTNERDRGKSASARVPAGICAAICSGRSARCVACCRDKEAAR